MFWVRYSLRNPQAAHDDEEGQDTIPPLLCYHLPRFGWQGGVQHLCSTQPDTAAGFSPRIKAKRTQHLHQQQLKKLPVLAAQNPGITLLILIFFFFKEYNHQKLSLAGRLTAA